MPGFRHREKHQISCEILSNFVLKSRTKRWRWTWSEKFLIKDKFDIKNVDTKKLFWNIL